MCPHKSSKLDPKLEQRLRDEAKSAGPGPSPYLHTRIMAEVTSLHAEHMGRKRWRWVGALAGGLAAVLVLLVALQLVGQRTGGSAPSMAGINPPPSRPVVFVSEQTLALSQEVQATVNDPFKSELESLGTDMKRAAAFLGDCLPL